VRGNRKLRDGVREEERERKGRMGSDAYRLWLPASSTNLEIEKIRSRFPAEKRAGRRP